MTSRVSPQFVLIGAQKAGTTYLAHRLSANSRVHLPVDEVPFFEDPFFDASNHAELDRAMSGAGKAQIRGIRRAEYLARPECPQRLRNAGVERLIAVLRDPVDRAVSAYCWYIQFGHLPVRPAEQGLRMLLDGWSDPQYPRSGDILEMGCFGTQLERYLEHFPREAILVLLDSDLRGEDGVTAACEFLGVAAEPPISDNGQANAGVYDMRRLRVLRLRRRWVFQWESEQRYTYMPRQERRPIPFALSLPIVVLDRLVLARVFGNAKPELSPPLRQQLRAYFEPEMRRTAVATGLDLSHWYT